MSRFDGLMHVILVQLELASTEPASRMNPDPVHGSVAAVGAPQPIDAPHLRLRARYERATDDAERRDAIIAALAELRNLRYSRRPNVDLDTRDGRLAVGRDPRPVSVLTHVYGYSERHIYRLRKEARDHDAKVARSQSVRPSSTLTPLSRSTRAPSGPQRNFEAA